MTLIEAAKAALDALDGSADFAGMMAYVDTATEIRDAANALRAAIEAAEKAEPAAYRVECRWADPELDQTWRKYSDYGTRKAAELSQQVFANPGDIETRIVPLYAGTPKEPQ